LPSGTSSDRVPSRATTASNASLIGAISVGSGSAAASRAYPASMAATFRAREPNAAGSASAQFLKSTTRPPGLSARDRAGAYERSNVAVARAGSPATRVLYSCSRMKS
jgi:hypothetical protein